MKGFCYKEVSYVVSYTFGIISLSEEKCEFIMEAWRCAIVIQVKTLYCVHYFVSYELKFHAFHKCDKIVIRLVSILRKA